MSPQVKQLLGEMARIMVDLSDVDREIMEKRLDGVRKDLHLEVELHRRDSHGSRPVFRRLVAEADVIVKNLNQLYEQRRDLCRRLSEIYEEVQVPA
ncbi:MAG TPA: hypothetical protein VLF21_00335 [Candidatus Saccharimonadales bacterium]|nr:hypothetical protein [Candidatus Saccharimonadales bacterium]